MKIELNSTADINAVLALKTWAVVGLGQNPERAAFSVAKLLQNRGHRIIPVHPNAQEVHGEVAYSSLQEIPDKVDVVDCFVNSERVGEVVDQAIAIGAKAVWLQLDVIDQAAVVRAQAAGLIVIMDRCPVIEYETREQNQIGR